MFLHFVLAIPGSLHVDFFIRIVDATEDPLILDSLIVLPLEVGPVEVYSCAPPHGVVGDYQVLLSILKALLVVSESSFDKPLMLLKIYTSIIIIDNLKERLGQIVHFFLADRLVIHRFFN